MAKDFDVELLRGRLRARRFGEISGTPALCAPGLSSNSRAFEALGELFEKRGRCLIAFDLRGRGLSDITEAGTYGWENHALDIFEAADALGIKQFDFVGHSMGAFVGMTAVSLDRGKHIRRLVLIDGLGQPSQGAIAAILSALARREGQFKTQDDYLAAIRSTSYVEPWNAYWDAHYRYDLIEENGLVRPRTSTAAVTEDAQYGATRDPRALWATISIPALIVRATIPLGGTPGADVVTKADYDEFLATVPNAKGVEIAANHYGIVLAPEACEEIEKFLR